MPPPNEPAFPNHAEVTGKCLNVERGSADLKSAGTVGGWGRAENKRNITNSSTACLFAARRLRDIDISADRTGERARSVQVQTLPAYCFSARLAHDALS